MQIMRILIANDDGIYAAGIKAIAAEFSKKHQVMVVAPDQERSGASPVSYTHLDVYKRQVWTAGECSARFGKRATCRL